jgi:hypothetical protein
LIQSEDFAQPALVSVAHYRIAHLPGSHYANSTLSILGRCDVEDKITGRKPCSPSFRRCVSVRRDDSIVAGEAEMARDRHLLHRRGHRQHAATPGSTAAQHCATSFCSLASSESMDTLTTSIVWLVSSFHRPPSSRSSVSSTKILHILGAMSTKKSVATPCSLPSAVTLVAAGTLSGLVVGGGR